VATYKEEAIVLRAYDLGEADRIVALLTAKRGLRRAVAKGIKRTGSKFGARLEPFTYLNAILHEGRNLDTVVQAETINTHALIRDDYTKFLFGEAMLELIEKSVQENQVIPRLFGALCTSLDVLEGEVADPALLLAAFELKVCALIGYHPHLERCLHCGREIEHGKVWLDLVGGGVACGSCKSELENRILLSPETHELMRFLLSEDMVTIGCDRKNSRLARDVLDAAFRFSESFLERSLKSRRVIFRYLEQHDNTL
jgi:DNA repair protein RecO (recombination protein O)